MKTIHFKSNLKAKRQSLGITQKRASEMIGVKIRRYQAWEEGRSEPSMIHQVKIVEQFGIDDLYLLIKQSENNYQEI